MSTTLQFDCYSSKVYTQGFVCARQMLCYRAITLTEKSLLQLRTSLPKEVALGSLGFKRDLCRNRLRTFRRRDDRALLIPPSELQKPLVPPPGQVSSSR